MGWKNWDYWLKGGVIGVIIIFVLLALCLLWFSSLQNQPEKALGVVIIFYALLILLFLSFPIGALTGWLIKKFIKKKDSALLKGLKVGIISSLVISIVWNLSGLISTFFTPFGISDISGFSEFGWGILIISLFISIFKFLFIGIILGALIGWIVGKIRNRNQ